MVCLSTMARNTDMRWRLPLVCLVWEVAMIVLFGIFVRFNPEANVADWEKEKQQRNVSDIENEFYFRYPCEYNYTRYQASLGVSLACLLCCIFPLQRF